MNVLVLIAGMLAIDTAAAQNLKVTVRSDREPLAYAYVSVNGRAAAITDSLGIALLPDGKWQQGDTHAAAYVGVAPVQQVIGREVAQSGSCELVLSEIYTVKSEEVTVKADVEKLFRKTVRACKPFYYQAFLHADFDAAVIMPDGRSFPVSGQFVARNSIPDYPYFAQITTQSDTSNRAVTRALRSDMLDALCTAKAALAVLVYPVYQDKAVYGYLGRKDGYRIFRVSYPNIEPGMVYQVIVWAGEKDGIIRRYEVNRVEPECTTHIVADGVRKSKYTLLLCDHMLMPSRIHAVNTYANGTKTESDIRNWRMVLELTGREVKFKD